MVSLGTSATLFGMSSSPVIDPSGTIAPFCDATGAWLPLICLLNCTSVLAEVRPAYQHFHFTQLNTTLSRPQCIDIDSQLFSQLHLHWYCILNVALVPEVWFLCPLGLPADWPGTRRAG